MDIQYGLVFRDEEDDIWLGIYENSTIRAFGPLSDFEDVYVDLPLSKFEFVEVNEDTNERIYINDLFSFEMCRSQDDDNNDAPDVINIVDFLKEIDFPCDGSDDVFRTFLKESGKGN